MRKAMQERNFCSPGRKPGALITLCIIITIIIIHIVIIIIIIISSSIVIIFCSLGTMYNVYNSIQTFRQGIKGQLS